MRGSVLAIFAVPKEGAKVDREEVLEYVKREFSPVAVVSRVFIVNKLPKTRSGKIVRRVLRAIASGGSIGDITTLEDETSIDEVKRAVEEFKIITYNFSTYVHFYNMTNIYYIGKRQTTMEENILKLAMFVL